MNLYFFWWNSPLESYLILIKTFNNNTIFFLHFRLYELCLALSEDGSWNRGQCIHFYGDENPCILFIDDGSQQNIHVDKIRKMPNEFAHRYVTVDCTIKGFGDSITAKNCSRLETVLEVGKTITARSARKIESTFCKSSKDKFEIEVPEIEAAFQDNYI